MAIDIEIKKKLSQDWQEAFPQLSLFGRDKLYKVLGPVIIGIELIKMPREDKYRPHFVTYPLWEKDIKSCFNHPFMLQQFYNEKKLQYNIPYDNNVLLFNSIVKNVWLQSLISFDGDISLKKIIQSMNIYADSAPTLSSKQSYMYGFFLEAQMKIALYIDYAQAVPILEKILKNPWKESNFQYFNIDLNNWFNKLQNEINNRDEFLQQILKNKSDKKINKLSFSELII